MADMLALMGGDERFAKLNQYLRAPDFARHSVFTLLGFCKIRGDEFLRAMREAVMAPAYLEAQASLARGTPEVVERTVQDAKQVWIDCPSCAGDGRRGALRCPDCEGIGRLFLQANLQNRKLVLEMAGLVGRGNKERGVTVNVNQAFGVPDFEDRLSHAVPIKGERADSDTK